MSWVYRKELDAAARIATDALEQVRLSIKDGTLIHEPEMNGAFASHLASAFRNENIGGITWQCRHLRASGRDKEEKVVGADIVIAINIDLPHFVQSKGLLIQNKRDGTNDNQKLLQQINMMEAHTTSPWLGVLSGEQIRFDSAKSVKGRRGSYSRSEARIAPYSFFRDFFQCEIGDENLTPNRAEGIFKELDGAGLDAVLLKASKG